MFDTIHFQTNFRCIFHLIKSRNLQKFFLNTFKPSFYKKSAHIWSMRTTPLSSLKPGDILDHKVKILNFSKKQSRSGRDYLQLEITDGSVDCVRAFCWKVPPDYQKLEIAEHARVSGRVEQYSTQITYAIDSIQFPEKLVSASKTLQVRCGSGQLRENNWVPCGTLYQTTKAYFDSRECACPTCGSPDAQAIANF